jgi:hypothetical protein
MAFPIVTAQEQIGQLYVGYFGRAADPDGLNYWVQQLQGGMSLSAIANSFAVQPEATALYSFLAAPAVGDPAAFITAIYQDLFNHGPDAAGLAYWVNQLTVQHTPPGQMVLNIISGAQGADKTSVENKTHVAVDYAQKFVNNNLTWIAIDNTQGAHDVVTPVTADPATVVTAIQQIDGIISQELTNPQNISLSPNLTTIQSGGTVAITLHADPSQAGKDFQYTITGVQSSEVKGGVLSGTVKLGSDSTAVINIGTVTNAANLNTPNETIKVTVGPISTSVTLTEGTQTVTQTGPVNEGNSFNFDVITAGIAAGAASGLTQTYTISGPGLAHIPVAERSGTVHLDQNGHAVVTVHTLATLADSGDTHVTITVGTDAPVDVTIHETAVQHIDPSAATIQEGAQVVFKITTTGVAGTAVAGQVENWTLSGPGAGQINGPLSGTVTLDQDGTATVTISTLVNGLNDLSPANLVFTLLSGAVPVGTATVGISQGSQVTTNTGPVNEGSAFSFTVTTSGIPAGSVEGRIENYTLTGPGLDHIPVAERSGTVVLDANGNATITVHTLADLAGAGDTTVDIHVGNNAVSTVTIHESVQQSVATSAPNILEGGSVVFTINTLNVLGSAVAGQTETWTLGGAAASQVNGPLSGTVTLDSNGSATVTISTNVDALNDGLLKNLTFTLKSGSTTTAVGSVDVLQGTQVTTAPASVNEGNAFSFDVTTSGVAQGSVAGRVETYTITGPGLSHIPAAERTGQVTLDQNGHASVTVHTLVDLGQLGPDPIIITVGNNAPITVNVQDTAVQTVTVAPVSADIIQGASLTFTIHTDGAPAGSLAGTTQTWTLTGTGINQVTGGVLSGTVTLDANNSAVVTVGTDFKIINMNGQFGPPGTQNLVFHLNSGGTDVTSPTVTIHESTLSVTAPASPIVEGNQVTYTIAGVNIPNGTTYTYTLSGTAIGNVAPSSVHGTVTINNNAAVVVVNTLGGDLSGVNKGLTLTIDQVQTATGTAQISETAPASIILTTNTDTPGALPPSANTLGNAAGNNSYFAVANSSLFGITSTLGQNDVLDGNSNIVGKPNTLFLNTTGAFAQLINSFTSNNIQIFNINAGQAGAGTTVDMSSAFGVTNVVNSNSSGKLTLLNVTQAADVEIANPSDVFPGVTVDMAVQYQNNLLKPTTQNLKLDPTVSPITGLANSRFWVNVDKLSITSAGGNNAIGAINGLITINGATNGFGATALTSIIMHGDTSFVLGTKGSGQAGAAYTAAGNGAGANLLDLRDFRGTFYDVGDSGAFPAITAVGGLTIIAGNTANPGNNSIDGKYVPASGYTGATQVGTPVTIGVGGNFELDIWGSNVNRQSMLVGGNVSVNGFPFPGSPDANGGLLNTRVETFGLGSSQSYQGFNGGMTGTLVTNNGDLSIGTNFIVNGIINEVISTGKGQAIIFGGTSLFTTNDTTLDFSGAGTTGFHDSLKGVNTMDKFTGGNGVNTLIIDPMITNVNGIPSTFGTGLASTVQHIDLVSPAGTPWAGTEGGTAGNLPTNTVDLGRLNQVPGFGGIATAFTQTIHIDGPLGGVFGTSGQTFKDAVSGDTFIINNNATPGGSIHGQVLAVDFALPTANNVLNLTVNNINQPGGAPSLVLRDFEVNSLANQNPVTTLNLQSNRNAAFGQTNNNFTLDNLNRLTTLDLKGTSNRFNDGTATILNIGAVGGAATLNTITGADQNYNLFALMFGYQSTAGGTITLGNGINTMGAIQGNWTITSGLVPGGGTAGDSGNNNVFLSPQLGNLDVVKTGGGNDTFNINFQPGPTNGGGRVDISSGAGNDLFLWNQAGVFPSLNSAQKVDGGDGRDKFLLVGGALNENDSLWGQITHVEILKFAGGGDVGLPQTFNNSLLLNFFANQSGLDTIQTAGAGASNVIFEGTGFTNKMRYEIAPVTNFGGDFGHDAIIVAALPSGSNAITVNSTTAGYNLAFETGLMTNAINPGTGLITKSGIFANGNAANILELTADGGTANVYNLNGFGTFNMQTIQGKFGGFNVGETVWLVNNNPATGTNVSTVDLTDDTAPNGGVHGNAAVFATSSTIGMTIKAGGGGTNNLQGGKAADTIISSGQGTGAGTNFLWGGGGGGDTLTGAGGGIVGQAGSVFYINQRSDSPGGPQLTPTGIDVHITNFHSATDTLLINPFALALVDIPTFIGTAADYGQALALLSGGGAAQTQAVYQADIHAMWIDADNNGLLNANDIKVFIDFASPGFDPGTINFGAKLGNNVGDLLAYIDSKLNPATNTVFTNTLLPGEWLFGGPGNNNTLTLQNGDVADGILIGFEKLAITSGFSGTLSIREWNGFYPQITGGGAGSTAIFRDGLGPWQNALTVLNQIGHYDFSKLTALTGGVTVTSEAFLGTGPAMQAGDTLVGTDFNDTFNFNQNDLKNAMSIDGGKGVDTLNVDVTLTFGTKLGVVGDAGTTDAVVRNVENLNLLNTNNNVGFNAGTEFTKVIGGAGQDIIRDPENLAGAWFLDVMGGAGLFNTNIIQVHNTAANLAAGTIQATGGAVALDIDAPGTNTTMTFGQYTLFEASKIGPFLGIFLTGGATYGNTTITFANQVTGGAVLDPTVQNWVFSSADDTFTLGKNSQNIDVTSGGADTVILNIDAPPTYNGSWKGGSSNDTVVFAANANISGVNSGNATTFGQADFTNNDRNVTMTFAQHNGFAKPFNNTGGTQTINLTDGGTATGDAGIEQYRLNTVGGPQNDVFTVAADNGKLTTGHQNVAFGNGNDTVIFGNGTFTGTMSQIGNAGDLTRFTGNADVSGVNSGGPITPAVDFTDTNRDVTMTVQQHNAFQPNTANFFGTAGTQTIHLTAGGTTSGDVGIENYVLETGPGNAYTFTVHNNAGMANPPQNVTVTAAGAADTIRYGDGTFTGNLKGLSTADPDTVQFFGNADISGVNNGKATGAAVADFSNAGISVSMTLAQHNGFLQPFASTAGTQTITLTTSGTATGDAGIEQYFLASGNDVFTVAPNNGSLVGGAQNVDISSGGSDVLIFGSPFSGKMHGVLGDDTYRFVTGGGDVNIAGLLNNTDVAGGVTGAGTFDFTNANLVVSMTAAQHQHPGASPVFINTANVQTIVLTTNATVTGDAGIENYILKGAGSDNFTVGAFGQSVDLQGGGADTVNYGNGTWTGNLVNGASDDTVKFIGNTLGTDISGVNGGNTTGVGTFDFNSANLVVSMTLAQHNGPATFSNTANTQTIKLTTSGTATGNAGIEQYILASGNDVFTVAPNNGGLVGGAQNVDISSGGSDVLVFGTGAFSGKMNGVAADDTYRFVNSAAGDVDIHLLINNTNKIGGVTGAGTFDFSNSNVQVSMTVEQHNGPLPGNFINTANNQTIVFTNDGTATGNAGIETYVLGQDGSDSNKFTIGAPGQNVTGGADDDIVINPYGGLTGTLLGGAHHGNGDTLILQAANTIIKTGSNGFENLTLQAVGNSTVTMDVAFHNGITKNVVAPGASDTIILTDFSANVIGLKNIENYTLLASTGVFSFTLSDSQTGTITGSAGADNFVATGNQMRVPTLKINGNGGADVLTITTDAHDVDLQARTSGIAKYLLNAGSTANVTGENGDGVTYDTSVGNANTFLTMGVGKQTYVGGSGSDDVTFGTGNFTVIKAGAGNDTVRSTVGGVWAATTDIEGGTAPLADTLVLTGGDDLSLATVIEFENLVLATNAAVTMTNAQHNQFTGASTIAPGNELITITDGFTGTTMKNIENYNLKGIVNNYTVAFGGVSITDNNTALSFAKINTGLDNVKLTAVGGGAYDLILDSNTNLNITLNQFVADTVHVTGKITGSLNVGDFGGIIDILNLHNGANISTATVGIGANTLFERLDLDNNGSFTMTADQYVSLTLPANTVNAAGFETVNITTSSGTILLDRVEIEAYVLGGAGNDTFNYRLNAFNNHTLDITAGGNDTIILTNAAIGAGVADQLTVTGFATGAGVDHVQSILTGVGNIGNAGFQQITAANTNLTVNNHSTIGIASTLYTLANPNDVTLVTGEVVTRIASAIQNTAATATDGFYTVVLYDAGPNGDVYQFHTTAAAGTDVTTANIDQLQYVGQLTGVALNSLNGTHFT